MDKMANCSAETCKNPNCIRFMGKTKKILDALAQTNKEIKELENLEGEGLLGSGELATRVRIEALKLHEKLGQILK
jgi:hypothetical protein